MDTTEAFIQIRIVNNTMELSLGGESNALYDLLVTETMHVLNDLAEKTCGGISAEVIESFKETLLGELPHFAESGKKETKIDMAELIRQAMEDGNG